MTQIKINTSMPAPETDLTAPVAQPGFTPADKAPSASNHSGKTPLPTAPEYAQNNGAAPIGELPVDLPLERVKELENALQKMAQRSPDLDVYIGDYSDILKYIGNILIKNADAMRQSALMDRMGAREAARGNLLGQSGKMHKAADDARTLALQSLVATAIFSGISIAASAFSLKGSIQTVKVNQKEASDLAQNNAALENLKKQEANELTAEENQAIKAAITGNRADAESISRTAAARRGELNTSSQKASLVHDASNALGGAAKTLETSAQASIRMTEADGTLDAANAQYAQQQADLKKELYDKIIDLIQHSLNMYREMLNSQAEAMRAITKA